MPGGGSVSLGRWAWVALEPSEPFGAFPCDGLRYGLFPGRGAFPCYGFGHGLFDGVCQGLFLFGRLGYGPFLGHGGPGLFYGLFYGFFFFAAVDFAGENHGRRILRLVTIV